jgi:hypothetical protein
MNKSSQHDGKLSPTTCKQLRLKKKKKLHFLEEQGDDQQQNQADVSQPICNETGNTKGTTDEARREPVRSKDLLAAPICSSRAAPSHRPVGGRWCRQGLQKQRPWRRCFSRRGNWRVAGGKESYAACPPARDCELLC